MKILIIGAGRVGSALAAQLVKSGHSVTVIDKDASKVESPETVDAEFLVRDATDPKVYEELELRDYDVVVAVTDKDEVNLFVAAVAKLYNVNKIYVRAKNPETSRLLRLLGVEGVVVAPLVTANILYSLIEGRYRLVRVVDTLIGEFHIASATVRETSPVRGLKPADIERKGMLPEGVKILSIYHEGVFYEPEEAPPLEPGYVVIALVHEESLKKFSELF